MMSERWGNFVQIIWNFYIPLIPVSLQWVDTVSGMSIATALLLGYFNFCFINTHSKVVSLLLHFNLKIFSGFSLQPTKIASLPFDELTMDPSTQLWGNVGPAIIHFLKISCEKRNFLMIVCWIKDHDSSWLSNSNIVQYKKIADFNLTFRPFSKNIVSIQYFSGIVGTNDNHKSCSICMNDLRSCTSFSCKW